MFLFLDQILTSYSYKKKVCISNKLKLVARNLMVEEENEQ